VIPLPLNIKAILIGVVLLATFVAGWTAHGWKYDANLKSALQDKIELQQAYDDYAREVVTKFQNQQAAQAIVYRDLKRKVPDVTDDRICFADGNAFSLWNSALTGNLPKATTRTTQEATSTSPSITDEQVLTNAIENFEQAKAIRDQLNALIDWYEANK
jgi:hypothetical protein